MAARYERAESTDFFVSCLTSTPMPKQFPRSSIFCGVTFTTQPVLDVLA
jgi:hypothetical protein